MVGYANSTETADGTVRWVAEVSATPENSILGGLSSTAQSGISSDDGTITGFAESDDTIDVVGRPMEAIGHAPFSDGATGVGGGGAAGEDRVAFYNPPGVVAEFHPRDELFLNGVYAAWNIDDAGIHMEVVGQHWYGVTEN